jgi:hypothetical protein
MIGVFIAESYLEGYFFAIQGTGIYYFQVAKPIAKNIALRAKNSRIFRKGEQ